MAVKILKLIVTSIFIVLAYFADLMNWAWLFVMLLGLKSCVAIKEFLPYNFSFSYFLVRQNTELEKLSAYECGFELYEDTRHKFDISFCLIGVLFILFDIEIMFLISWFVSVSILNFLGFWPIIDFLLCIYCLFIIIKLSSQVIKCILQKN